MPPKPRTGVLWGVAEANASAAVADFGSSLRVLRDSARCRKNRRWRNQKEHFAEAQGPQRTDNCQRSPTTLRAAQLGEGLGASRGPRVAVVRPY
jgi:hypothetical protein